MIIVEYVSAIEESKYNKLLKYIFTLTTNINEYGAVTFVLHCISIVCLSKKVFARKEVQL